MAKEELEKELTKHVGKLLKIKDYCINLKTIEHFDKIQALNYILKIIMEDK